MNKNKGILFLAVLMLIPSGCWNRKEPEQMDYVIAVGIDISENNNIALTIQSPSLEALKPKEGGGKEKTKTISVQGKTAFEAIRNYINAAGRKIFWGHTQVYLIGEEAAKAGVERFLDFFSMDPELRGTSQMAVVKGKAKDLVESKTQFTTLPASYLSELIRNSNLNANAPRVVFSEFNRMQAEPIGGQPYLPLMELMDQGTYDRKIAGLDTKSSKQPYQTPIVYTGGTAVFKATKLVGYLNERETRGLLWTKSTLKSAIVNVKTDENSLVALELIGGAKAKKKVTMTGDSALLKVTIQANVNIGDRTGYVDISDESKLKQLENGFEEVVRSEVEAAFNKSIVKLHSDIMAFGNTLSDRDPKTWKKIKDKWEDQILPHSELQVEVKAKIRRTSRTIYSPWMKKEEED